MGEPMHPPIFSQSRGRKVIVTQQKPDCVMAPMLMLLLRLEI